MAHNTSLDVSFIEWAPDELLSQQCNISEDKAKRVCKLFDEGYEVAFVARYRVAQTGNMTTDEVRRAHESYKDIKVLEQKIVKAANTLTQKVEGPELVDALKGLQQARDNEDILVITQQFAAEKRVTKAAKARELGLAEAAQAIFQGKAVRVRELINGAELNDLKTVETHLKHLLADLINKHPETLAAVRKIGQLDTRLFVSVVGELSAKAKKLKPGDPNHDQIKHFERYTNFTRNAHQVENCQILALERGAERDIVSWKVQMKDAGREHPLARHPVHPSHLQLYQTSFAHALDQSFVPKCQRAISRFLTSRAEQAAIECFARNLRQLFSQQPLSDLHIIALDPGYKACKMAFLSPLGEVLGHLESRFGGQRFSPEGLAQLKNWCKQSGSRCVFAVGDGTASRETQVELGRLFREKAFGAGDWKFCVVSESGASKYSVTPLAEAEFPDLPPTTRSAISLGRRLLDPMGEYVKIEPQHLGMGMYQHSVPEKKLSTKLKETVREAVSMRGVNVNTASLQLLQQVCGLNKTTAAGIIKMREIAPIKRRADLQKIKGLGAKSYEQCAGFLIVLPPDQAESGGAGEKAQENESVVRDLLLTEEKLVPAPLLQTQIRNIGSLKVGERLSGRVQNTTDFGVFVDIGAEKSGLLHRSKAGQQVFEVGQVVDVCIDQTDAARQRIGLRLA
ncbi:unnamed protein product, partial [Mesorhabditis spiculigera]